MRVPDEFQDLPGWVKVISVPLAVIATLSVVSMVLGILFAAIAVGVELGSVTAGVVALLFALLVILVPIAVGIKLLSGDDKQVDTGDSEQENPVEALREQYMNGDVDEETFERRLDRLLTESSSEDTRADEDAVDGLIPEEVNTDTNDNTV